jgi:hypothetical protein
MRKPVQDSTNAILSNGIMIKGTYAVSMGGTHVTLYMTDSEGLVLAQRHFGFADRINEGPEILRAMLAELVRLTRLVQFDKLTQPRIIALGAVTLMNHIKKNHALAA